MVITKAEARARALGAVSTRWTRPVEVQDELTLEFEFGWVFFYNSTEFLHSGRRGAALFGNAPVIVSREGRISWTGTSYSIEQYVAAYKALGPDRFDAGDAEGFILTIAE